MNKLMTLLVAGLLAVGATTFAQQGQDPAEQPQARPESGQSGAQTLTGCLKSADGKFTLTESSGRSVTVAGSADLASHENQHVQVTGRLEQQGGEAQFMATQIRRLAAACEQ